MTNGEKLQRMRDAMALKSADTHAILEALIEIVAEHEGSGRHERGRPLAPGDVVRLRSGGPAMTVLGILTEGIGRVGWLRCEWFTSAMLEPGSGIFPEEALRSVEDEQGRLGAMRLAATALDAILAAGVRAARGDDVSPEEQETLKLQVCQARQAIEMNIPELAL